MQFTTLTHYRNPALANILYMTEDAINDYSPTGVLAVLNLLRARLKAMKRLGKRGHHAYDVNRHFALAEAFKLERIAAERLHPITLLRAEAKISKNSLARVA